MTVAGAIHVCPLGRNGTIPGRAHDFNDPHTYGLAIVHCGTDKESLVWEETAMGLRPLKWWKIGGIGILILIFGYTAYAGSLQLTGNFHEVIAGELYRSAQPSAVQIARYKAVYGIKTIVNLRGRNADRQWYRQEIAASDEIGLDHIDFRMSAHKLLSRRRAAELIAILKSAKKPILIHCKAGADRSGLVSALYLAITGHGEKEAESQISLRYGHVGVLPAIGSYAMFESFERLENWLGLPKS